MKSTVMQFLCRREFVGATDSYGGQSNDKVNSVSEIRIVERNFCMLDAESTRPSHRSLDEAVEGIYQTERMMASKQESAH